MSALHAGEVAWYATGRFYRSGSSMRDAGYFLHLAGIEGDLFEGDPGESTACFTFLSTPFEVKTLSNGSLEISLDHEGEFAIYHGSGGATFDDPSSFARGERVAVFRRISIVVGAVSTNVFTAKLIESRPFCFRGRDYDFRELLPFGITQWGNAGTAGADGATPFAGSAIAISRASI